MSVEVWMSAFRASGGIPSGPAALPDLRDLIAFKRSERYRYFPGKRCLFFVVVGLFSSHSLSIYR